MDPLKVGNYRKTSAHLETPKVSFFIKITKDHHDIEFCAHILLGIEHVHTCPRILLEQPRNDQWQNTNMVKIEARATQNTEEIEIEARATQNTRYD